MKIFTQSVVGIEIQDHRAQFVELKESPRGVELTSYNRITIPEGLIQNGEMKDPARLKEVLKDFFAKANPKIGRIRRAALILPARVTFVHIFRFPISFSASDIRKAIPYQAETIIPFAMEEVYWDDVVLKKDGRGEQIVLFTAVPKATAEDYTKILQHLGVTPFLFGVHADALRNALLEQINPAEVSMILDLESIATNYLIMHGENMVSFFSANEGIDVPYHELCNKLKFKRGTYFEDWQNILENREGKKVVLQFVEKRLKQAGKIIEEQQRKGVIKKINTIYLTGEFATLEGSIKQAEDFFKSEKIEIGDPKKNIIVENGRFKKRPEDFTEGHLYSIFFTNVIGIAKEALKLSDSKSINLLPASLKSHFSRERYSLFIIAGLVLITLTGLLSAAYSFYLHQILIYGRLNVEVQKDGIERKLFGTRYQEIKKDLTQFNEEVAVLSSIDAAVFSVADTLRIIYKRVPEGVTFTGIKYNDESLSMDLSGIARSRTDLFELQQIYEAENLVHSVQLPIASYDKKTDISFTMNFILDFPKLPPYGIDSSQ